MNFDEGKKLLQTELMCYKCMASAALSVVALNYFGDITVNTSDVMSYARPFGILFGSHVASSFVWETLRTNKVFG